MDNNWFYEYFINEVKAIKRNCIPTDGSQSDWNQNDDTKPDYVKNRPFYTGDPAETVLVEESTVAFAADDGGSGLYVADVESTFEMTVGETYKISWDDTVYECPCQMVADIPPAIGNLAILDIGPDTGEPFVIGAESGYGNIIFTADTSASHTISISGMVAPVVKIDKNYLPDNPLKITGAAVDQIVITSAVDEGGNPTEWGTVDISNFAPAQFKPAGKSYLTFSSSNNFTLKVNDATKHWNGVLEYFASDRIWTVWDGACTLSAIDNNGEYVLYLRGTGNTVITGNGARYSWGLTGTDIKCIGNIENLLDYATAKSGAHPIMENYCYYNMFSGCTSLTQAPALPATTLAGSCYYNMFRNCSSLKLSSTKTDEYTQEYRIPSSGNGTTASNALRNIFASTGGTFTGDPEINTTYYLSSDNMTVRETEIATLNGYVDSMIDAAISEYADTAEYIIHSSTEGSTKKFKITVDDTGTLSATEVT